MTEGDWSGVLGARVRDAEAAAGLDAPSFWGRRYAEDVAALLADVRRLRAENESLRGIVQGLAERVAAQAELPGRRAEKGAG